MSSAAGGRFLLSSLSSSSSPGLPLFAAAALPCLAMPASFASNSYFRACNASLFAAPRQRGSGLGFQTNDAPAEQERHGRPRCVPQSAGLTFARGLFSRAAPILVLRVAH